METEVSLAIVSVGGTLIAAIVYAIRKWVDAKETVLKHEQDMQVKEFEQRQQIEDRREKRNEARIEVDKETAKFISANTEVLRDLQETIREMQEYHASLFGNGIMTLIKDSSRANQEILDIVRRIESKDAQAS